MTTETIALISAGIALLAATGAWSAVFVNRQNNKDTIRTMVHTGARTSRASVVSGNRQKWIDAIRADIAEFIGTRRQMELLSGSGSDENAGRDAILTEARQLRNRAIMLRARVEMRLNLEEEDDHVALLAAMDRYDHELSDEADEGLRLIARKIFKAEWERLKKEAAGIDPFVREAIPQRRIGV